MFQVMRKWRLAYLFSDGTLREVWLNDNFASNILRRAGELDFSESGLDQPIRVTVSLCGPDAPTSNITTTATTK